MTTLYKLTTSDYKTRKGHPEETQWGEGVTHTVSGEGELCGRGWLHAYTNPLLAVLLNPIHAAIENPVLWECSGEIGKNDRGLKVGCKQLITKNILPIPQISTEQKVRFAILCAMEVCAEPNFRVWANNWLDGKDRSEAAARAAEAAAEAVAWAAAEAAEAAAWAAAEAAARAAETVAVAALVAALAAAEAAADIDLIAIAEKAIAQ